MEKHRSSGFGANFWSPCQLSKSVPIESVHNSKLLSCCWKMCAAVVEWTSRLNLLHSLKLGSPTIKLFPVFRHRLMTRICACKKADFLLPPTQMRPYVRRLCRLSSDVLPEYIVLVCQHMLQWVSCLLRPCVDEWLYGWMASKLRASPPEDLVRRCYSGLCVHQSRGWHDGNKWYISELLMRSRSGQIPGTVQPFWSVSFPCFMVCASQIFLTSTGSLLMLLMMQSESNVMLALHVTQE